MFDAVVGGLGTGRLLALLTLGLFPSWPGVVAVAVAGCLLGGWLGAIGQWAILWQWVGWGGGGRRCRP